jgi:hypothetical protein
MNVLRDSQTRTRGLGQGGGTEVTTPPGVVGEQEEVRVGEGEQLPVLKLAVTHLEL